MNTHAPMSIVLSGLTTLNRRYDRTRRPLIDLSQARRNLHQLERSAGPIPIALAAAEVAIAASRACGNGLITYVEASAIVSQAATRNHLDPAAIWVLATRLLHLECQYGHVDAYRRHAALSILALGDL
jgi:hypothetical protein